MPKISHGIRKVNDLYLFFDWAPSNHIGDFCRFSVRYQGKLYRYLRVGHDGEIRSQPGTQAPSIVKYVPFQRAMYAALYKYRSTSYHQEGRLEPSLDREIKTTKRGQNDNH
jgi:hypothetical protein